MNKYPYQYKTPEEVFAATEKRMEKRNEDIKAALIAHLNLIDSAQLRPLYQLVRASAQKKFILTSRDLALLGVTNYGTTAEE